MYIPMIILAILVFLVFNEPGPVWFFPIFVIAYFLRKHLSRLGNLNMKLITKYVIVGVIIGLAIEFLAIIATQSIPYGQRELFHQAPIPDLILALGYYATLMLGSYFILKRYKYSLKEFFILGGIFGLIFEAYGQVFLSVIQGNFLGGIYVFLSYSSLIALPYMIFEKEFEKDKTPKKSSKLKYIKSLLILALFHLIFLAYFIIVNPILGP